MPGRELKLRDCRRILPAMVEQANMPEGGGAILSREANQTVQLSCHCVCLKSGCSPDLDPPVPSLRSI
jgi:hypothetical protein